MRGRELLHAGIQYGDVTGPIANYHGFILQRHVSGKGTVITYKAADATIKRMLVLDAQYRSVQKFGTYTVDVPGLTNFQSQGASGWYVVGNDPIPNKEPMSDTVNNDAIYNQWNAAFATDKTAKENCDIWMSYNNKTDSNGIQGVPAVAWCRNQIVDGKPCDLGNEYETIVLWACGDQLDEMDPTGASYPDLRLGYTSTAWPERGGRCQKFNGLQSNNLYSSTEYSSDFVRVMLDAGYCHYVNKRVNCTVVPILELD